MLTHYLQKANETLSDLIETTRNDIEDIKAAKHDHIFSRTKTKDELVKAFENQKSLIDNEISKMVQAAGESGLETILSDEQQELLDQMRQRLKSLQNENRHFATMVIAISEFYSSLINRLVPTEQIGYENHKAKRASYLHIKG